MFKTFEKSIEITYYWLIYNRKQPLIMLTCQFLPIFQVSVTTSKGQNLASKSSKLFLTL